MAFRYAQTGNVFVLREINTGLWDYVEVRKSTVKPDEKDKIATCKKCGNDAKYLDTYAPYGDEKTLCEECSMKDML